MRVETSTSVPRASIRNRESQRELVAEARTRLVELGLASPAALAEEPAMDVRDGDALYWVNVTFAWGD